jgi:hypothetical protein
MKAVIKRTFSRKVRGLTSKIDEIRSNPRTTDFYPIVVPQLYQDKMDRYLKDFAKIYGFNEPPRELTQEQVAGGGQVMLPKQGYE